MSKPIEPRNLPNMMHSPPLLSGPRDPRKIDGPGEEREADLKGYLNTLYDNRWRIGGVTALTTMVAALYALVAQPVYEANMMIHVEEESPNVSRNILSEASSLFETKQAAIAEMELLRSRMVVSQAVDNLHLYVEVRPKYFPIAGAWFAAQKSGALSEPGLFGYGGYVWGDENAVASVFNVPDAWLDRPFALTARGNNRYRLAGQQIAFEGVVGQRYSIPTSQGPVELKVDRLYAKAGARFEMKRRPRLSVIQAIQAGLMISEQGKQSGVVEVKLEGDDAGRVTTLLSEISREYMRQNLARKTEQAEKSLAFLNRRLPTVKRQLEQSEERYNQFRNAHGTVDLREEGRMNLAQASAARMHRLELLQKRTELLARFTETHPVVVAVDRQRVEVEAELQEVNARIKALPVLEQEEGRLARDIAVNTELYTALSNSAQQLRMVRVGRVSNVRLIDPPVLPEKPVRPKRPLIVALGAIVGLLLGLMMAFLRKAMSGGIDEPQQVERLLGARVVYGTIPHSVMQEKLSRNVKGDSAPLPLLAQLMPQDGAVESLRSFRAALQFAMPHFRNNIVMMAGATRSLGKSFISANLAAVIASSGKRVLLIDADFRNGHLHRYFGVDREVGLSNAIHGSVPVEQVIHRGPLDNLDFISTGPLPPNRSEFLMRLNFGTLLETISASYDLVLIDTPPILQVADALIIGAQAGAVFVLARARVTTDAEISESIKRLNHAGLSPQGVLFNDMTPGIGRSGAPYRISPASQLGYSA